MTQSLRKQFAMNQVSQGAGLLAWFPADYPDAPPFADGLRRIDYINGMVRGLTVRRLGSNYTVTTWRLRMFDNLSVLPTGIGGTDNRQLYDSGVLGAPAAHATDAFLDVRFEPERFQHGFWILLEIASSAGAGTDNYFVTVQGELDNN